MQRSLSNALSALLHTAPAAVLYGCLILFLLWLGCVVYLLWSSYVLRKDIRSFAAMLYPFRMPDRQTSKAGLPLEKLDSIRKYGNTLVDRPRLWWISVNQRIEPYGGSDEKETWFLSEGARDALPYEVVVGKNFNVPFLSAVPSILTGLGLTLTFVAILLGLLGVHYDKANTVEPISGIDVLINGLSGKFLSSIVALLLSMLFTLMERIRLRSLRTAYEHLVSVLTESIPFLSPSRILLDIQRSSAKASVSVSHISSEVVDRLLNGFNERVVPGLTTGMSASVADVFQGQLGPTMSRMTSSLDDLQKNRRVQPRLGLSLGSDAVLHRHHRGGFHGPALSSPLEDVREKNRRRIVRFSRPPPRPRSACFRAFPDRTRFRNCAPHGEQTGSEAQPDNDCLRSRIGHPRCHSLLAAFTDREGAGAQLKV
jgi:hypothetical protein